jgi:hypothetical protein
LRNNIPLLPTAILSRISINIVDRFIAILAALVFHFSTENGLGKALSRFFPN